ncbi:hypothetical protein D3C81_1492520 [compost metagenome]
MQGCLGRVVFALAGVTLGQQFLLTHERRRTLRHPRLLGDDLRLGRIDIGLQILRVEPGQHLLGCHSITDVNRTLDDLATHTKRQLRLYPCLDITGEGNRGRVIRRLDDLHEHPRQVFLHGFFLVASRQQGDDTQGHDYFKSGNHHANSLAFSMYNSTESLEQDWNLARASYEEKAHTLSALKHLP